MRRFTLPRHASCFLAVDGPMADHVRPIRHRLTAAYRETRTERADGATLVGYTRGDGNRAVSLIVDLATPQETPPGGECRGGRP